MQNNNTEPTPVAQVEEKEQSEVQNAVQEEDNTLAEQLAIYASLLIYDTRVSEAADFWKIIHLLPMMIPENGESIIDPVEDSIVPYFKDINQVGRACMFARRFTSDVLSEAKTFDSHFAESLPNEDGLDVTLGEFYNSLVWIHLHLNDEKLDNEIHDLPPMKSILKMASAICKFKSWVPSFRVFLKRSILAAIDSLIKIPPNDRRISNPQYMKWRSSVILKLKSSLMLLVNNLHPRTPGYRSLFDQVNSLFEIMSTEELEDFKAYILRTTPFIKIPE